ncbi:hypothetical protein BDV95DRAFT_128739 [Massariosphaeria phaeospora]|uniref:Uncharacterized protein n=1 Tax=Massariosphaeria phaeospora TaxID=100035 RepID=A0A7C8M4V9_9PLEO|nr:hypothetical protein BDV95DRAFT_128739 [Massariosphaeria phaeospora]
MNRLKHKASRFFKEAPSQDEHAANAGVDGRDDGTDFHAGIQAGVVKKKSSRFLRATRSTELLASADPYAASGAQPLGPAGADTNANTLKKKASWFKKSTADTQPATSGLSEFDFDFKAGVQNYRANTNPNPIIPSLSPERKVSKFFIKRDRDEKLIPSQNSSNHNVTRDSYERESDGDRRTSFDSQRTSYRDGEMIPFPPAPHSIPASQCASAAVSVVGQPAPGLRIRDEADVKPRLSFSSLRSKSSRFFRAASSTSTSTSHTSNSAARARTSRPSLKSLLRTPSPAPATSSAARRRTPPPRPPRPESLDAETLALLRDSSMRMCIPLTTPPRASVYNTATQSASSPRELSLDPNAPMPLAARVSSDFRFGSAIFANDNNYNNGADGMGMGVNGRPLPVRPTVTYDAIEQFDPHRTTQWEMLRRVSGGTTGATPGVLWRDESGRMHFVADI